MKEIIAGNLIHYRKGLNFSQEELAELTGVTRQSINNYENVKTLPDSKTLSALARALGIKLDDLLRRESTTLPNFRFRAHTSFDKKPQFAASVLRLLEAFRKNGAGFLKISDRTVITERSSAVQRTPPETNGVARNWLLLTVLDLG